MPSFDFLKLFLVEKIVALIALYDVNRFCSFFYVICRASDYLSNELLIINLHAIHSPKVPKNTKRKYVFHPSTFNLSLTKVTHENFSIYYCFTHFSAYTPGLFRYLVLIMRFQLCSEKETNV